MPTFLQIFSRYWRTGVVASGVTALLAIPWALTAPVQYEAQAILDFKPAVVTPIPSSAVSDIGRITVDNQRMLAVIKSRYITEQWLASISTPIADAKQHERALKRLGQSLSVKPVNFTDLFVLRVRASSNDVEQRLRALIDVIQAWDATERRAQADELAALLFSRMAEKNQELVSLRKSVVRAKSRRSVNLSGSASESMIDAQVRRSEKDLDDLSTELEYAQRAMILANRRIARIVVPVASSAIPVRSRMHYLLIALTASVLIGLFAILLSHGTSQQVPAYPPK